MLSDLGILWEWEHDTRFVLLLDSTCYKRGKRCYLISLHNLDESIAKIQDGKLRFRTVLDRASDTNEAFKPVINYHRERGARIINDPEKAALANDKARMHLECIQEGLHVPYTLIVQPSENFEIRALDLMGTPFVIKPAQGGGGEGVVIGARDGRDIAKAREYDPEQPVLIQEQVFPREFNGKRCWFRVFFVCGKIIGCFWDDTTHIYQRFTPSEERNFIDLPLIMEKIHTLSGLEFFSTEIAQWRNGRFVIVDYVNDQCDMRFQSDTPDGVPDAVVEEIATAIVTTV